MPDKTRVRYSIRDIDFRNSISYRIGYIDGYITINHNVFAVIVTDDNKIVHIDIKYLEVEN